MNLRSLDPQPSALPTKLHPDSLKAPADHCRRLIFPRILARWVLAKHFHGNESLEFPIKYDIQENHIRLGVSWDILIITFTILGIAEDLRKYANKELDRGTHERTDNRASNQHQREDHKDT